MARVSKYSRPAPPAPASAAGGTAGVYLRLSVEDGDDAEHNSIASQKEICMAFLQTHPDLRLGGVYTDNGYTGMNYKRPGFQALFGDLQAGRLDCVIVKDVSRLGRHYILTSEYVERTFPQMGARLICVNDNYDSADPRSDRDSLLMPFQLIMNDAYVKDTSQRVRSSIAAKMRGGEYLPAAGSVPYGYRRDPAAGAYAIDGEAAPTVRRIFALRAEGMAFNAIARQLNEEGVPSPGRLRYDRGLTQAAKYRDALWLRGAVRKITGDEVYVGSRVHGKMGRERLGGEKKSRAREAWQIIPNAHPPIVSQALFDRVQAVNRAELARREGFARRAAPQEDHRDILLGKVFCGDCGGRMSACKRVSPASSAVVFNCNAYHDSNRLRCANHTIAQETILAALGDFLDGQLALWADGEALAAQARRTGGDGALRGRRLAARNRREAVEARQLRCLEDLTEGLLDRETYDRLQEKCRRELEEIAGQEAALEREQRRRREALSAGEAWLAAVRRYQKAPVLDRGLVDALVEKILVFEDRSVQLCLTYADPIALLAQGGEGGDGRGG